MATNEKLHEEGKRIEIALKYVTQINQEYKAKIAGCSKKTEANQILISREQFKGNLQLSEQEENVKQALKKEYLELRNKLKINSQRLESLKEDPSYSFFNERQVWFS